jgi:hypothetical protein
VKKMVSEERQMKTVNGMMASPPVKEDKNSNKVKWAGTTASKCLVEDSGAPKGCW